MIAFLLAVLVLGAVLVMSGSCSGASTAPAATISTAEATNTVTPSPTGEVEATEFLGSKLTPVKDQGNTSLIGTQIIDKDTYRLKVDGLVDHALSLSYQDLLNYPQISKLQPLNCVEGWKFVAKWTGPSLNDILKDAGVQAGAINLIFYTEDSGAGFTSLDLDYIQERNIILGLKDNDITLPPERGFPFQVVSESKYGYKWAKWVNRIEVSNNALFRGYWEGFGYNNNADVAGPAFESGF